jgi:signal transduction histidine kinase
MSAPRMKAKAAAPPQRVVPTSPEARTAFLRMVSHELRTPLNSIIGFAEILNSQVHGPLGARQYEEYAGIIRDSGYKMLKLVNQVLELIRLSEGMVRLDVQPTRASFAVLDAMDLIRADAQQKGVALAFDEPEPTPWVLADPRALRNALGNLMQNAVTFSPAGGTVRVAIQPTVQGVAIEICDDGPGLPEDDLTRVLSPFEMGDYALTRTTDGAGLGLPTARLLCQVMGGDLELENRPDGGLRAVVVLIAAEPDEVVRGDRRA